MIKPEPLTPPDCDLRGMPYMELDVVRLLDSDFFAMTTGDEFKAGVALWGKSWNQIPAASLPLNERVLAHLAGVSLKEWGKLKEMALHGWFECSDGRLYHPTVAEKAAKAWAERQTYRTEKTSEAERKARERQDRADMFAALKAAGLPQSWNAKTRDLRQIIAEHGVAVVFTQAPKVTDIGADVSQQERDSRRDVSQPVTRTVTAKKENGNGTEEKKESFALVDADATPGEGRVSAEDVRVAFGLWNDVAKRSGLAVAKDFTDDRKRKIGLKLRLVGMDGWRSVLATIEASDFCRGGSERGWRITLDNLFQTKIWNTLRDGGYGAVKGGPAEFKPEVWAQLVSMWRAGEPWPETAGPAPDQPGTRVPKELLVQPVRGAA